MASHQLDKYDAIRVLGEGSFGKVYLMRDKVRRTFVCVKIIKIKNIPKKEREATRMEVDLLRRLHHPNIVRYIDSFLSKNHESLCICMEYCDGGDLASQIKAARRNLFSESKILHWFVQMALGLHYMHTNKVLHRDLKTQNVFLLGNGRLVLGDLGISKVLDGTMDFAQTCIGTPYYMSPEIFKNKPYSYKSDVWALGCVLYEMTSLNHAFDATSLNGLAQKIIKGKYPPIHHKYSKNLRDLVAQMLNINPQLRPDLDQILRKPFIKKHIINFFLDIESRPAASIGEGTMIVRAAIGAPVASGALSADNNMLALRQQLKDLDMTQAVAEALAPRPAPADPVEAKRLVKEQAGALKREEEHKRMVEAALEKLRQERELRSKERAAAAAAAAAPTAHPAQSRPAGPDPKPIAAKPAPAPSYGVRPPAGVAKGAGINDGRAVNHAPAPAEAIKRKEAEARDKDRDRGSEAEAERRRRSFGEDRERDREQKLAAERAEEKRREEARVEARLRDEARIREDVAAKQRRDQLQAQEDAAARREQQRERERARQRNEIEQLKRDKLELDRRAEERERRAEEARRAERERRAALGDEKGSYGQQFSGGIVAVKPPASEDKEDGLTAREKVLLRKQEKLAKEEEDRVQALRAAEQENRRIRLAANSQHRNQYQHQHITEVPVVLGGPGSRIAPLNTQDTGPEARDIGPRPPARGGVGAGSMELDELTARLHEATKGRQARYDAAPSTRAAEIGSNGQRHREQTALRSMDGGSSDSGSDIEDETEALWSGRRLSSANAVDEDEDMHRREEELEAELNMATLRCEELKKTLQETKSFASSFSNVRGAPIGVAIAGARVAVAPPSYGEEVETDDDDEDADQYEEAEEVEEQYDEDSPEAQLSVAKVNEVRHLDIAYDQFF